MMEAIQLALKKMDLRQRVAAADPTFRPTHVIAVGKAAPAMAQGALDAWRRSIKEVFVVTLLNTDLLELEDDRRVKILKPYHPYPVERAIEAAKECLAIAERAKRLVVLISGGASSMMCLPLPGITLADKQWVTFHMIHGGASIQELNIVRKHMSQIKGGRLAKAAKGEMFSLIASDVIGGKATDVGSGPTVKDPSTVADARKLLKKYAPDYVDLPLQESPKGRFPPAKIISSPEELSRVLKVVLDEEVGIPTMLEPSTEPVEKLAKEYIELSHKMRLGDMFARVAEPTLKVNLTGKNFQKVRGGRCSHLAALVAKGLRPGTEFYAIATDGVDGSSLDAGCHVDCDIPSPKKALRTFNTGTFMREIRHEYRKFPMGHNLCDVHVLTRYGWEYVGQDD